MAGITGCAFYYRPAGGKASGEKTTGPSGLTSRQTSNRAELRAVIAALQYRVWYHRKYGTKPGEGREKVIIATDSQYVVLGITEWIRTKTRLM